MYQEQGELALLWASHIYAGKMHKVLVLDLDDTLWSGAIGRDGPEGIKPNLTLQRKAFQLWTEGVVLAISSKNNEDTAMSAWVHWPDMPLLIEHFATWRINWRDKATNLREMAEELNVGLDSFVFFDNSPRERAWVRSQLPEVTVPELPDDLSEYADILRDGQWFEGHALTKEDRSRGRYYIEQRQRRKAQATMAPEDFYYSLQQAVKIRPITAETISRAVQMLRKTNQFNLTAKRYTKQDLIQMFSDGWEIFTLQAEDKFGDSGIVGVAMLRYCDTTCVIDSFLLSCRAIGRTIETAFLSWIVDRALAKNACLLVGCYRPTDKNAVAADFYQSHGFNFIDSYLPYRFSKAGMIDEWGFPILSKGIDCPEWIAYA